MNADGSGTPRRLTDDPAVDWEPSWSPSGNQIAFTITRSATRDIFKMDADGSAETRLTYSAAHEAEPI